MIAASGWCNAARVGPIDLGLHLGGVEQHWVTPIGLDSGAAKGGFVQGGRDQHVLGLHELDLALQKVCILIDSSVAIMFRDNRWCCSLSRFLKVKHS